MNTSTDIWVWDGEEVSADTIGKDHPTAVYVRFGTLTENHVDLNLELPIARKVHAMLATVIDEADQAHRATEADRIARDHEYHELASMHPDCELCQTQRRHVRKVTAELVANENPYPEG